MEPLNIFEYEDYRLFLKAFYESRKKSSGSFSYRRFSKLAKNQSPNFVKLVIDGHRNLTVENIYLFAVAMGLSVIEHDFFFYMVLSNQETRPDSVEYFRRKMKAIEANCSIVTKNPISFTSGLESYWYESVTWDVISYSLGKTVNDALKLLKRYPSLSEGQVLKIIDAAIAENIIERDENGILQPLNGRVAISEKWKSQSTKTYVQNQLSDLQEACERFYSKPYVRFSTISFTFKDLKVLQRKAERIAQILSQEFYSDDDPDPTAHDCLGRMNYQIFPVYYDTSEDPTKGAG